MSEDNGRAPEELRTGSIVKFEKRKRVSVTSESGQEIEVEEVGPDDLLTHYVDELIIRQEHTAEQLLDEGYKRLGMTCEDAELNRVRLRIIVWFASSPARRSPQTLHELALEVRLSPRGVEIARSMLAVEIAKMQADLLEFARAMIRVNTPEFIAVQIERAKHGDLNATKYLMLVAHDVAPNAPSVLIANNNSVATRLEDRMMDDGAHQRQPSWVNENVT